MRQLRVTLAALVGATMLTAVSLAGPTGAVVATPSLKTCKSSVHQDEYTPGKLTVATDNPVYPPWFVNNKPGNTKGYESAVVYALARVLGIASTNVTWVTEPFNSSYTPGPKAFDFDINEISYTADRAKAVSFSNSYYDVQQSIVALKTDAIVTKHSPAQLKSYLYGDQVGTTGLAYINNHIKPTRSPRVYSTLDQAVLALKVHQIDAIVIDTPTGQYMATAQILGTHNKMIATQVGQFPTVGEHYGLLFKKNSPLVGCVNAGLAALRANGTLTSLAQKWLGIYTSVPVIKP
jgi:polar amino acid transport system substrate-binding protein